jgi:hypothetical protein
MHKDLLKIKACKCQVEVQKFLFQCQGNDSGKCKHMPETFLGSCKAPLNNLISSNRVQSADTPFEAFPEGLLDFHVVLWCEGKGGRGLGEEGPNTIDYNKTTSTKDDTPSHANPRRKGSELSWMTWLDVHRTMFLAMGDWQPTQLRGFMVIEARGQTCTRPTWQSATR